MIAHLLPALRGFLNNELAHLRLVAPEKDAAGKDVIRAPQIFIGDFPLKRAGGKHDREFPCVVLLPSRGSMVAGEILQEVVLLCCVYNAEEGDGQGAEMDLSVLVSSVAGALRPCLDTPLGSRFRLAFDDKGRWLRWERAGEPTQPRPYAQIAVSALWASPGWE